MRTLTPTHVVFNGAVGALTGDKALTAKVGEKVHHPLASQPRYPSAPDRRAWRICVHARRAQYAARCRPETWFIPGAAAAAFYTFRQPGIYAYVNHNLIEAFELARQPTSR